MNSKINAPKISLIILSSLIPILAVGCSLARNSDREDFDNKAVTQTQGSAFSCSLKIDNDQSEPTDNGTLIEIACGRAPALKTIVRVSR